MTRFRAAVVLVLTGMVLLGGCRDDGDDPGSGSGAVTSTTRAPDDATPASTASTAPGPVDTGDWDGTRFDIGIVDRIDRTEDGRTLVVFDRVQLETEDGRKEAAAFDEEPIVYGNTDYPFVNENTRLRTYVVAPDVEVLVLDNPRAVCPGGDADPADPVWRPTTVDAAVDTSVWSDFQQVSLTFSGGLVARIRFSTGC